MTSLKDMGLKNKTNTSGFEPVKQGTYDAYVHAIISLGTQPQAPDFKTGRPNPPDAMLRVLFELPDVKRSDDQTSIVKLDMRQSANEKSYYFALYKALFGVNSSLEDMVETPLEQLLNKSLSLTVLEWHNPKTQRSGNNIKKDCLNVLDERLKKVATAATRETFLFNPYSPDLVVFKSLLSYWTQKNIMEAVDNELFPKELHQVWAEVQESNVKENKNSNIDNSNINTESIE